MDGEVVPAAAPPIAPLAPKSSLQSLHPSIYGTLVALPEISGHPKKSFALGWSQDGTWLASGSTDKTLRIWDVETTTYVEGQGHTDSISQLTWDPTSTQHLATAGQDKTVRIWDARSTKATSTIQLSSSVMNVAYSHDGKYIAALGTGSSKDTGSISLIDMRKHKIVTRMPTPYEFQDMIFSETGFLFAAAGHPAGYGTLEVLQIVPDATDKKLPPTIENIHKVHAAHSGSCFAIDIDKAGRTLALGGVDSLVSLWDLEEIYCKQTFICSQSRIRFVKFSHDGVFLAPGSDDLNIPIIHIESGQAVFSISLQEVPQQLAWHPSKHVLAYLGDAPSMDKNKDRQGVIKVASIKAP
ncbi:unnamed protein product [Aphanomyces euteiches]|uniref:Anaphase-promoting complex subunit 4 WD40 domain-containing protein n=1 Tax=Aphanomyces euteiches TaxID=100861 RepID=A0A6G0XU35_9STRA|nr:hypothetical protein Ae201684_001596 [Aphanomyces euteiches]KAH9075397.1 hypothetical protein Ae201684P_004077 [Aphanomyces euteiches]KAH9143728.1 hypothetical protein AeRB84_012294 [Aphanomyces euteiches]